MADAGGDELYTLRNAFFLGNYTVRRGAILVHPPYT